MFSATYFTYDGVFSGEYGLMIADFNDSSVDETAAFSPSFTTHKPAASNRFFYGGINYDSHPTYQFSIISEGEIPDNARRRILSWLVGRNEFKTFRLHQPMFEEYYYRCVFSDVQIIYVNGHCHGFRLTANFDSPYQYGKPSKIKFNGTSTIKIKNKSDIVGGYVYPVIKFEAGAQVDGVNLTIVNNTDDSNTQVVSAREFVLSGLANGEMVTVDNEMRHIQSDSPGERLSNFNKNWLRLCPGVNELSITTTGSGEIICPTYMMIGF